MEYVYKVYGTGAIGKALPKRKYLGGVLEGGKSLQDGEAGEAVRQRKLISLP